MAISTLSLFYKFRYHLNMIIVEKKNNLTARVQVGKKASMDYRSCKLTITVKTNEKSLYTTLYDQ